MPNISVCITTHNRYEALKNALYFVKHQTHPIKEVKIYASGYEDGLLDGLGDVSYEHDYQDWGHHKRAKAYQELTGDYIWTAADDDQYPFTFLERMLPGMDALADIVYCNFATKTRPEYYIKAQLQRGSIGNGCVLISKKMAKSVPYRDTSYGGDWLFIKDCIDAGATSYHIDETLHFHA
jgi:glycosyltransferase involved in cell wall biosynthesis